MTQTALLVDSRDRTDPRYIDWSIVSFQWDCPRERGKVISKVEQRRLLPGDFCSPLGGNA